MSIPTAQSVAQILMDEVAEIRTSVSTLREFAEILAAPQEGMSMLQRWTDTMSMLVDGQSQVMSSLQSLHKIVLEPGIAAALRRAVEET